MKILYIPLDERPCNYYYPPSIANICSDIEVVEPPKEMLGRKKVPAKIDDLWKFVEENAPTCDALVLSLDMLLFGGIVPSRLHYAKEQDLKKNL